MEHLSQKEIEEKHHTTLKNVFITLILIIILIIVTAFILRAKGYSSSQALFEGFHIITHFPKFSFSSVFVSILSVVGALLGLYILVTLVTILYGGGLKYELKEGRKMSKIKKIKNHVIICGSNLVGNNVAIKLDAGDVPFVVVDNDPKGLAEPRNHNFLVIEGNPLDEEILKMARIKDAAVLIAVMEEEGGNFLLSSMAKKLNPKIKVVAKTDNPHFVEHLEKIGADLVMMPEILGAFKIADVVKDVIKIEK